MLNFCLYLIVLSAFMPYIIPAWHLSFEYFGVAITTMISFIIILAYPAKRVYVPKILLCLSLLLVLIFILTLVSSLFSASLIQLTKFISGIFNNLKSILIIFSVCVIVSIGKFNILDIIKYSFVLFIFLLVSNTIIILGQYLDIAFFREIMPIFAVSSLINNSPPTYIAAMHLGRYTGVLNVPFTAGSLYIIGIFCFLYLFHINKKINIYKIFILILLFVGGGLSFSKAFLFLGCPLVILYLFIIAREICNITLSIKFLFLFFLLMVIYTLIIHYNNYYHLLGYIKEHSVWNFFLGTRYGSANVIVIKLFNRCFHKNLLLGLGFFPFGSVDSGYIWYYLQAGFLGVGIFVIFELLLLFYAICNFSKNNPASVFLFFSVCYLIFSNVGEPVLIMPHIGIIYIYIITILCMNVSYHSS